MSVEMRLLPAGGILSRAFARYAGMDNMFVSECVNVRDALDKRLERALFKDDVPSSRVQKALGALRVGDFTKMSLFGLVDKVDTENALAPLFAANGESELRKAFGRLRRGIMNAHPDVTSEAVEFIDELEELMCDAKDSGVKQDDLSDFYKKSMAKVSVPTQRYASGDGSSREPRLDIEILAGFSKAQQHFHKAINDASAYAAGAKAAAAAKGTANPKNPKKNAREKKGADAEQHPKKQKQQEQKGAADALAAHNKLQGPRAVGVAQGKSVPLPAKGHADLKKFRDEHPTVTIDGVGKRGQCWDFFHPQGCTKANCRFAHGEA